MPPIPSLKAITVVKTFQKAGWKIVRQRGSHIIMVKQGEFASLSIPNHNPVARGTLRSLIRCANMSVSEFISTK